MIQAVAPPRAPNNAPRARNNGTTTSKSLGEFVDDRFSSCCVKNPAKQIRSVARWQGFAFNHAEGSAAVSQPFCAKEQRLWHPSGPETPGQVEHVSDVKDLDSAFKQRSDDLASDFGALSFIGRREGLVQQNEAFGTDTVHNCAHPPEFFVQLAAFQVCIFFPLEVREDTAANVRAERLCCHEHATLHHQMGLPETPKTSGLPAPIGARDDDQRLLVGGHLVSDGPAIDVQA